MIAMIARAFVRQDPFVVWGDGRQIRNWTYVGDIVERHDRSPPRRSTTAPPSTSARWSARA